MRATAAAAALLVLAPLAAGEGLSLSVDAGWADLSAAHQSAKAIFDATGGSTFGAAIRKPLGADFFVEAGARVFRKQGERAFVADRSSPAFRLGHPLELRLIPIQATFAYRLGRAAGLDAYVGLGGGVMLYRETSTVGGVAEPTLSRTRPSAHVLLGVDRVFGRARVGLAAGFAIVPSSLGLGGVSQVYEEEDIGGVTALVRIGFGSPGKPAPAPTPEP